MSQAIDIMNELEKVFDKEKAKVLTNAILKREEEGNLVTKDYLHMEINGLKADLYKEMSLRFESMNDNMNKRFDGVNARFIDVQKSITRMTIYFISAIGTIAIILKVLDLAFGK